MHRHGPVSFAIMGANFPGAAASGDLDTSSINNTGVVTKRGPANFVGDAVNAVSSLNNFNVDKSTTLQPFDIDKSFNLVSQQIDCSAAVAGNASVGASGKVTVDVDAKMHAVVSLGVAAAGTIVPPNMEQFWPHQWSVSQQSLAYGLWVLMKRCRHDSEFGWLNHSECWCWRNTRFRINQII